MLLLLACTSAANMLLARVSFHYREIVVRVALGATGRQILAHVLVESLIFSIAAVISSILLTTWVLTWLIAWFRANDFGPAYWQSFNIDWRVLMFTGGAVVVTVLLTSLPAALRAYRISLGQGLRDTADAMISRPPRVHLVLLLVQVALSSALLISVMMMVRLIVKVDSADVGIREANLLTSRLTIRLRHMHHQPNNATSCTGFASAWSPTQT